MSWGAAGFGSAGNILRKTPQEMESVSCDSIDMRKYMFKGVIQNKQK